VHIPKPLLDAVDRRALKLRLSRNRLIIHALEREVSSPASWSPGFFQRLENIDAEDVRALDEMLEAILAHRTRKGPRGL
jgi:hypothetical protein